MPVQSRRNNSSKERLYSDFRGGGLNLSASERMLSEKEVGGGKNFIYERNGGRFRTLEPLEAVLTAAGTITSLFYSVNFGVIFSVGTELYRIVDSEAVDIGTLAGTDLPNYCDWGEEVDRLLFVVSGSVVQYYNGNGALQTQTPIPVDANDPAGDKWNSGNDVMVREGRLLLARAGKDRLRYSGVGDPANWQTEDVVTGKDTSGNDEIDVHTDSDAQWLDVGYKEGGDIVRVLPISRDLVIFRTDGSLYRMFSSFPDWTVIRVASQVQPVNRDAIATVGNDIMFLDKDRGIRKVSAIEDNDTDLAVTEKEGSKVNAWLSAHFASDARLWTLPDRGEIWVRPAGTLNDVLCWNERYGGWTRLDLGTPMTAACEIDGVVYIALGDKLCRLNDAAANPYMRPAMELELAPVFGSDRAMTDYQELCVVKDAGATARIDFADWGFSAVGAKTVKRQLYVKNELRPVFKSTGGTVVLDKFAMLTAEVV